MKVLVAGASGAIGRQLVPALSAAGHEVVGLARLLAGFHRRRREFLNVPDVLVRGHLVHERASSPRPAFTCWACPG
jgi:nucleoside-diphosphate-sugar epimerase